MLGMFLTAVLWAHRALVAGAKKFGRTKKVGDGGCEILLTGTFYSANWIMAHLKPLTLSRYCRRVRVVTSFPIPPLDKVEVIRPPSWLIRLVGGVPARLLVFTIAAFRFRPHVVGGFHLLANGLVASLVGSLCGARSVYFCVGGPAEVLGGGVLSENRVFEKLRQPNRRIEAALIRAAAGFDLVITMGSSAKRFFRERGVVGPIEVISGGIDAFPAGSERDSLFWDVVFVGRLSRVKRIDLLLQALEIVKGEIPEVTAVIVGDGALRSELEELGESLGLGSAVEFVGYRTDVARILARSKVFVLTSETEGLSLALMEAIAAGLPAVVSDVGDLRDVVRDGGNGFLAGDRTPAAFASRIVKLLRDRPLRERFSKEARNATKTFETATVARRWDNILASWGAGGRLPVNEPCAG